jgi:hypothetical protein
MYYLHIIFRKPVNMPDRLRNKKKDNAKKTRDLYGNYSAKNVRMYEAQREKRLLENINKNPSDSDKKK